MKAQIPWLRVFVEGVVIVASILLAFGGCTSWRPVAVSLRQFVEEDQPERIRIFQADGTRIELRDPRVDTVSLTAVASVRLSPTRFRADTVSIRLTDVGAVEARHFSIARTFLLVVGVPVGLVLACVAGIICDGL